MIPRTIDDMVDALSRPPETNPIATANYGDGEWACILGEEGKNCNGDEYGRPGLREALQDTILQPALTWYGYNPGRKLMAAAGDWLRDKGFCVPVVEPCVYQYRTGNEYKSCRGISRVEGTGRYISWMWKEVVSGANCKGEFHPFLKLCREKGAVENGVVIVGGPHLARFKEFRYVYIPAPAMNAIDKADGLVKWVEETCMLRPRPHLILFACGMASNVLIWRLARQRVKVHLVDVGAALDPYVGVLSRKTYKRPDFQERLERSRKGE